MQRWLETRVKEHKDACSKGHAEKSAIAEHVWDQQHTIDWEDTKVLDKATRPVQLLVKEALCIQRTPEAQPRRRLRVTRLLDRATMKKLGGRASAGRIPNSSFGPRTCACTSLAPIIIKLQDFDTSLHLCPEDD